MNYFPTKGTPTDFLLLSSSFILLNICIAKAELSRDSIQLFISICHIHCVDSMDLRNMSLILSELMKRAHILMVFKINMYNI